MSQFPSTGQKETRDPRRLLQHLDTFFGVRNQIKGEPQENVNFTLETLTYMTSRNRADQITTMIVNKMKELGKTIPFGVFECCSGIGGNTLSFLENPNIQWVVSYEILQERREMLKRNIAMYNLSERSFVPEEAFTGVPAKYQGVVLYMDPPWLPSHIKGHESTKDDYILEGIKIGDKTLEQWIQSCPQCAMIVFRVPPGYRLEPIPGFKVESSLLKNSLVYFVIPQVVSGSETSVTETTGKNDDKNDDKKWVEGLKNFLKNEILIKILPSEEYRDRMLSDEAMKIWIPAFTHESYDPNVGNNYEDLELVGDHSMEYNFIKYLYLTIPGITRDKMTILKSRYISKAFQGQVGFKWGLHKWIRSRVPKDTHMAEDALEALFGAIDLVGDMVFKFGAGNGLAYNLILKMFENTQIDISSGKKKKPKTWMKETFEQLHWGTPVESYQKVDRTTTATISLTEEAMSNLRSLGLNIVTPILAVESGTSKTTAFDEAYKVAENKLKSYGVTEEWVNKYREMSKLSNPEIVPYIQNVQNKLKSDGFEDFYFSKIKHTERGQYIQLIGIRPNGYKEILASPDPTESEIDGKKRAFEMYLEN